jgi:type III secretory pathway component EscR
MINLSKCTGLSFLLLALLVLAPVIGSAQDYGAAAQPAEIEVSDQEIQTFVRARDEVEAIRQSYHSRLEDTTDAEKQQETIAEANQKMVEAVQKSGLEVERYNEINNAALTDPELQERISQAAE